jgi:hypothetical protein
MLVSWQSKHYVRERKDKGHIFLQKTDKVNTISNLRKNVNYLSKAVIGL